MAAVTYKVITKHTKKMLTDFIKFRNTIETPTITFRFVMLSICCFTLGLIVLEDKTSVPAIISYVLGSLLLLFALTRKKIAANKLAKVDENYQKQNELTFDFGNGGFTVTTNGEETIKFGYHEVTLLYQDAQYYYVGTKESDLFLLPRTDFVKGNQEAFEDFIARKSRVQVKPTKMSWKMKLEILMQARDMAYEERQKNKK